MFNKLAQHLERLLQNNNVAIVRELQINVFALLGATAGGLLIEAQNINTYCRLLLKITQKWSNLLKNAQKCTKIVKIAQNWSKMVLKKARKCLFRRANKSTLLEHLEGLPPIVNNNS